MDYHARALVFQKSFQSDDGIAHSSVLLYAIVLLHRK